MWTTTRRGFLVELGRGLLLAGIGPTAVAGSGPGLERWLGDEPLDFGELEPLVARMQTTPPDELLPILVAELRSGASLERLVAAGALANARTFGGEDYNGYHAFMALMPSLEMARLQPDGLTALPVLKVLHRNAGFIQDHGGRSDEVLRRLDRGDIEAASRADVADDVRRAAREGDMGAAERAFAETSGGPPLAAFEQLQATIRDDADVHRTVLTWRAWDMIGLVGELNAHTLLRQCVRYCVSSEQLRREGGRPAPGLRELLPRLLDEYELTVLSAETRSPDDARIEELADTIFAADRQQAAEAMAAALAEGFDPAELGESLSLAGNKLLLHDPGRSTPQPGKPVGSVHGASVGVHASDAARAWRNIARVVDHENAVASLIAGAWHTGGQVRYVDAERPFAGADAGDHEELADLDADELFAELGMAVEAGDQARAIVAVQRQGELEAPAEPVFDLLLEQGTRADGALHAEKYFATVRQEFAEARPAFRWRHLVGLARVTASEQAFVSAGWEQARELLTA